MQTTLIKVRITEYCKKCIDKVIEGKSKKIYILDWAFRERFKKVICLLWAVTDEILTSPTMALLLPTWVTGRVFMCLHNLWQGLLPGNLVTSRYVQWYDTKTFDHSKLLYEYVHFFILCFPRDKELEMAKWIITHWKSQIISSVVFNKKLGPIWKGIKEGAKKRIRRSSLSFLRGNNWHKKKKSLPSPSRKVLVKYWYLSNAMFLCTV